MLRTKRPAAMRLAADIGGTFTDIAVFDDKTGALTFGKALSTPQRLVDGINRGVEKAGSDYRSAGLFLHGSTVAINAILERTGAKTALLITEGFRDVYEIGRINRPDAYNLFFQKHVPLVERALRFEVQGARALRRRGREAARRQAEIAALGAELEKRGIEACAILFINCYASPDHEARAKAILEKNHPGHVRLGLARAAARNIASSSAARPWSPTPISGRRCGAMSARSTSTSAAKGSTARS